MGFVSFFAMKPAFIDAEGDAEKVRLHSIQVVVAI